jgi:hypothetical protein
VLFRVRPVHCQCRDERQTQTYPDWVDGDPPFTRSRISAPLALRAPAGRHSSITTTTDIYVDWDIDQLAETMRQVLGEVET